MKKINISHVSNEHNRWLRCLNFYKTEISILKGMLTELAGKNTSDECAIGVERFENQFRIQTNNIDRLSHDIHINLAAMSAELQTSKAGYIDSVLVTDHDALGVQFEAEEKFILEITHDFRKFAEQWM
jgi:hypothetical protein